MIRHTPLAHSFSMSPSLVPDKDRMGSDAHKMKTLLLENYQSIFNKMHKETKEKQRIGKRIEELTESLFNTIEDFK